MGWKVREISDAVDESSNTPTDYGSNTEYFTIRVHHSGKFITKPKVSYIGGEVSHIDYCCTDELSKIEIDSMLAAIGLQGSLECYYSCTGADDTQILNPIRCDIDALDLGLFDPGESKVSGLFVDHESLPFQLIACPTDDNEVATELGNGSNNVDDNGKHLVYVGSGEEHLDVGGSVRSMPSNATQRMYE
ncbi:hypothetical protein OROMI_009977 [Orobanche minor]